MLLLTNSDNPLTYRVCRMKERTVLKKLVRSHHPPTRFPLSSRPPISQILSRMASSVGLSVPELLLRRAAIFSLKEEHSLCEAAAASTLAFKLFSNSRQYLFKRLSSCSEISQTRWPASSLSWRILTSLSRASFASTALSKS